MPTNRLAATLATLTLAILCAGGSVARAQDAPTDDALDRLLEKVEGKPAGSDTPKPETGKDTKPAKPADEKKPADKPATDGKKPADKPTDRPGKPAEGKGEAPDESLDKLLEGLGQTSDEPEAKGKPMPGGGDADQPETPPMPGGGGEPPKPPGDVNAGKLKGGEQQLDERLEEILGRKNRKKNQQQQGGEGGQGGGQGEQSDGPLGETIKKMDQVEQKLGEKDTGEKTREEQQQIVDGLKQLIKQAQQGGGKGKGQQIRSVQQGNNPGGQQPGPDGNTGSGTSPQKPKRPDGKAVLAENKDEWGHLPPELRGEMENVFKEEALPRRKGLIDRYYISINKKSVSRGNP